MRERAKAVPKLRARGTQVEDALAASKHLLRAITTSLEDDKAEDLVVIDLARKSSIADFMVIASGTSQRHLGAMAEHLAEELKSAGIVGVTPEGGSRSDWVLIDGGDIIVHLFRPEVRAFYALEKMWDEELAACDLKGGDRTGDDTNGQALTGWA